MTPWGTATEIADFLKKRVLETDEKGLTDWSGGSLNIYAGFLPYVNNTKDKAKLCPAIVIRPQRIMDGESETSVSMVIAVTVYDEDMLQGCMPLYHLLEYIRYQLLTESIICGKYYLKPGTVETTIPDEQPYPQWWGRIDFEMILPQPQKHLKTLYQ